MMGTQLPETCRKVAINILESSVHLVGFILKRLYRDAQSTKHKRKNLFTSLPVVPQINPLPYSYNKSQ